MHFLSTVYIPVVFSLSHSCKIFLILLSRLAAKGDSAGSRKSICWLIFLEWVQFHFSLYTRTIPAASAARLIVQYTQHTPSMIRWTRCICNFESCEMCMCMCKIGVSKNNVSSCSCAVNSPAHNVLYLQLQLTHSFCQICILWWSICYDVYLYTHTNHDEHKISQWSVGYLCIDHFIYIAQRYVL